MSVLLWVGWGSVITLFTLYVLLVRMEQRRGARYGVTHVRSWCDVYLGKAEQGLQSGWRHFTRYVLQLHWHYWIHHCYRSVLLSLQAVYGWFEQRFEKNRAVAKSLRAEKRRAQTSDTHLGEVVAHKAATTLTPAQKRALKKKSIESYE